MPAPILPDLPGPNERTIALGGHKIESAVAFWRNGAAIVQREPEPRATAYRRAVATVLGTLASVQNVPALIIAYYHMSPERLDALARACGEDGGFPLNRGICEDAAYYARLQELIAASNGFRQAGPFPAH